MATPPAALRVATADGRDLTDGVYLPTGLDVNGLPSWRRETGERWLYSSPNGTWTFTDDPQHFASGWGFVVSGRHKGALPSAAGLKWKGVEEGGEWKVLPGMVVAEVTPAADSPAQDTAAEEVLPFAPADAAEPEVRSPTEAGPQPPAAEPAAAVPPAAPPLHPSVLDRADAATPVWDPSVVRAPALVGAPVVPPYVPVALLSEYAAPAAAAVPPMVRQAVEYEALREEALRSIAAQASQAAGLGTRIDAFQEGLLQGQRLAQLAPVHLSPSASPQRESFHFWPAAGGPAAAPAPAALPPTGDEAAVEAVLRKDIGDLEGQLRESEALLAAWEARQDAEPAGAAIDDVKAQAEVMRRRLAAAEELLTRIAVPPQAAQEAQQSPACGQDRAEAGPAAEDGGGERPPPSPEGAAATSDEPFPRHPKAPRMEQLSRDVLAKHDTRARQLASSLEDLAKRRPDAAARDPAAAQLSASTAAKSTHALLAMHAALEESKTAKEAAGMDGRLARAELLAQSLQAERDSARDLVASKDKLIEQLSQALVDSKDRAAVLEDAYSGKAGDLDKWRSAAQDIMNAKVELEASLNAKVEAAEQQAASLQVRLCELEAAARRAEGAAAEAKAGAAQARRDLRQSRDVEAAQAERIDQLQREAAALQVLLAREQRLHQQEVTQEVRTAHVAASEARKAVESPRCVAASGSPELDDDVPSRASSRPSGSLPLASTLGAPTEQRLMDSLTALIRKNSAVMNAHDI